MSVQSLFVLCFSGIAMCMDFLMERVVNGFIVVFFLTGFFWQMGANGIAGTLSGGLGLLLPCVLLFPLFYFRMLGAGDIKLFSGLGIFLGVTAVFKLILCSLFPCGFCHRGNVPLLPYVAVGSFHTGGLPVAEDIRECKRQRE